MNKKLKTVACIAAIASMLNMQAGPRPAYADNPADAQPPRLTGALLAGGLVTLTYDEPLNPASVPSPGSFYVKAGGQADAVAAVQVDANHVVLTLQDLPSDSGPAVLTYLRGGTGIADLAGNAAANLIETPLSRPDTVPPALTAAFVDQGAVVLAYSEPLDAASVPTADNLYVKVNGAIGTVTGIAVAGAEVRVALAAPPAPGQGVQLTYLQGGSPIRDAAGNAAANLLDRAVSNPVASTAPALLSATVSGGSLHLAFSQNLNQASIPAAGSFSVMAAGAPVPVVSVSVNGPGVDLQLAAPVTGGASVTAGYAVPAVGALRNAAGVPVAAFADASADNVTDNTAPALTSAVWSGDTIRLVYDEPLGGGTPDPASFAVQRQGVPLQVNDVALADNTVYVRLSSSIVSGAAVTLSYAAPDSSPVADRAGNPAANLFNRSVADASDMTPPQLQTALFAGQTVTLTYNEALSPTPLPSADSFQVMVDGASRTVTGVAVTGSALRLTVSGQALGSSSSVLVTYFPAQSPSVKDLNGNAAPSIVGYAAGSAGDATAPTLTSAVANGYKLTLTYSEPLRATAIPSTYSYLVTAADTTRTVTSVTVAGAVVTLSLGSSVAPQQTVTLAYTPSSDGLRDLAGNAAAPFAGRGVQNATDATAPVLMTGTVSGSVVTLTYNEQLDASSVPPASAFTVSGGTYRTVNSAMIAGNSVILNLSSAATADETLTLNYSIPYTGMLRDASGNQASGLYGQQLTNDSANAVPPAVSSVTASDNRLQITYSKDLNASSVPAISQFTVAAAGQAALQVTGVSISGRTVTVTLAANLPPGQTVSLSYSAVYGGGIKDTNGNPAATLSGYSVSVPGNTLSFAGARATGTTVRVAFSNSLRAGQSPSYSDFRVNVDGTDRSVLSATVDGGFVVLTVDGAPLQASQRVAVSYNAGSASLQDDWGAFAPSFADQTVNVEEASTGTPPTTAVSGGASASAAYDLQLAPDQYDAAYETGSGGQTTATYRLKAELQPALAALRSKTAPSVLLSATGQESASTLLIPATLLAGKDVPTGIRFTLRTAKGSVVLPADWIDVTGLDKQFHTQLGGISVGLSISAAGPELSQELAGKLKAAGLTQAATPVTFEVFIEAGGKRYQMSAFNQYLNRKIALDGKPSVKDTTVVWYDRQSGELQYVPSVFYDEEAGSVALVKHMRTGTYVVVKTSVAFGDMDGNWAKTEVGYLGSKLVLSGKTNTVFDPNGTMTRAEFTAMLVRSLGFADLSGSLPYKDVPDRSWYRPYIGAAYTLRIIDPADRFAPGRTITRAEAAVMLYRAAQIAGRQIAVSDIDRAIVSRYKDLGALDPVARDASAAVVKAGFITGSSASAFGPDLSISRAQAAVILGRMLRYVSFINK